MFLSFVALESGYATSAGDKVTSQIGTLNRLTFLQRTHQHIHHLLVALVEDDLFQDVCVGDNVQGAEDNDKRDVLLYVWEADPDRIIDFGTIRAIDSPEEFDGALRHHAGAFINDGSDLSKMSERRRPCF